MLSIAVLQSLTTLISLCLVVGHENTHQYPPGIPPPAHQQELDHNQQNLEYKQQQHQHGDHQPDDMGRNRLMESAKDQAHVMEHLDGIMSKSKEEMTPEELQFYYFKLHDYDNNMRLDGTELIKAITHYHEDANSHGVHTVDAKVFSDADIIEIVDLILKQDDYNGDGYIEYAEFVAAQGRTPEVKEDVSADTPQEVPREVPQETPPEPPPQ